jgi:ABC-type bacteriocin/lantibiotic exporter with double-glycine peptidase domain
MAQLGSISTEAISNVRTVKAFASEDYEAQKYLKVNEETRDIGVRMRCMASGISFLVTLLF